jgi:hypothetical protein
LSGYEYVTNSITITIPSLDMTVTTEGPFASRVLETLTESPRFVAMAKGPAPTVPRSWRRVNFGGLRIAVPESWSTPLDVDYPGNECQGVNVISLGQTAVIFDAGNVNVTALSCGGVGEFQQFTGPTDGLVVDPGPYQYQLADGPTFGACRQINGLSMCPATSNPFGILVLAVHIPGQSIPVEVDIGLSGSGETARTILYSVEKS